MGDEEEEGLGELSRLSLPDVQGRLQAMKQWQGRVMVVNFWATWCEPCREEVPALVRVQEKLGANGLQIVGIGIDSAGKIREFAKEYQVTYPLVVAGVEVLEISRKLGNRPGGLPHTVVLDRRGRLAGAHLGGISQSKLELLVVPLLAA